MPRSRLPLPPGHVLIRTPFWQLVQEEAVMFTPSTVPVARSFPRLPIEKPCYDMHFGQLCTVNLLTLLIPLEITYRSIAVVVGEGQVGHARVDGKTVITVGNV